MPHYKHYHQADEIKTLPLIHLELDATHTKFNLKTAGDTVIISKMILLAMKSRIDVCAVFIAGVVSWCKENDIDAGDLKNMVRFEE